MDISSYSNLLGDYNKNITDALSKQYMPEGSVTNDESNKQNQEVSFGEVISNEIEKLNDKQVYADNKIQDFVSGEEEDLHNIMIATEEARLSLELAVQIRNKAVDAFNTVNNIQL